MVCTFGAPGSPPGEMVDAMRVSQTAEGVDRDVHRPRQVDAAEHDAGVGRRRPQRQLDPLPAVHAHADGAGQRLQGALRTCAIVGIGMPIVGPPGEPSLAEASGAPSSRGRPSGGRPAAGRAAGLRPQSACLRRNAGISISSMPLLASASTLARRGAAVAPHAGRASGRCSRGRCARRHLHRLVQHRQVVGAGALHRRAVHHAHRRLRPRPARATGRWRSPSRAAGRPASRRRRRRR